jgi:hypothetical protein
MRRGRLWQGLPLMLVAALVRGQSPPLTPTAVERARLCVTEGALEDSADGSLAVTLPKMRAFVRLPIADAAQAQFTYLGPSANESPLASGQMRRQFGLKLRALDACNLLYVMWRIAPESRLVVQLKNNPGQHSSAECTNHGYQTIKPRLAAPLPRLQPGESHVLRARISGEELRVSVDDRIVWQGNLSGSAAMMSGPVGVRSDNARIRFNLSAGPGPALAAAQLPACRPGQETSE